MTALLTTYRCTDALWYAKAAEELETLVKEEKP